MADLDLTSRDDETQPLDPDRSLGELFSKLTKDFSQLVTTQLELAKVDLKEEAARAGKGAGLLAAGGIAGHLAILLLSFAAAWGLATQMPTGFAFLIVGLVWAAVAAVSAVLGRKQLAVVHPVPPQSKEALREDIEWARQQKR